MPLDGPAMPHSKETALARQERRYKRQVASPKRWQAIADSKQGPCRVCAAPAPNELHHIVSRAQGGSDTESNIMPLCRTCHGLVEHRDPGACRLLVESLTDAEYSYAVHRGGEGFLERRYGIRYERAA